MRQNAYLLAKIGADTAENEQHFAEILPKTGNELPWQCPPSAGPARAALRRWHVGVRLEELRHDEGHGGLPPVVDLGSK